MISNIQHVLIEDMVKFTFHNYKEMWYIIEGDVYHKAGTIVAAITLDDEFLCYDEYKIEMLKFKRNAKLNKISNGI